MTEMPRADQPRALPAALRGFIHPYFQIAVGALLVTASEILLRRGAANFADARGVGKWIGITALASVWTWLGILLYILSFASWLHVLRFIPLSVAFPIINAVHVLIPIGSWLFLHEHVSPRRWIGIILVCAGILLLVRPFARAEQKL